MSDRIVRIGGASACEFDSSIAVPQFLGHSEPIDYLIFDELAELNVATMAGAGKSVVGLGNETGFARSFVDVQVGPHLRELHEQGIKLIANAGGPNPRRCAEYLAAAARTQGVSPTVAYVEGDNVLGRLEELCALRLRELATGDELGDVIASADRVLTLLAYIGAGPIAEALGRGADIVITGRAVDSAAALGALVHEFGWSFGDLDRMGAGSMIGHVIECGPQATGATFTDWREVPDWSCPSWPIAECHEDGSAIITIPDGTGGMATVGTVAEQLFYEVGDPYRYVLPDVVVDLTGMQLEQVGRNRVRMSGARGRPPTPTYKLQLTYERGWRGTVVSPVVGFDAADKAQRLGDAMFTHIGRVLERDGLGAAEGTSTDLLGTGGSLGAHADPDVRTRTREVLTRMTMDHPTREGAELFMREQALANVGLAQGVAMPLGHSTHPILRMRSFLLEKDAVSLSVTVGAERVAFDGPAAPSEDREPVRRDDGPRVPADAGADTEVPLLALAWGRSGDKGNTATLAVIARRREYLPFIGAALSADSVAAWLAHQFDDAGEHRVDRHYADGPGAFSFLLHGALGGGALESRRLDPMAKTVAQQLLAMPVPVPTAIAREATTTSLRPGV